MLAHEILGPTTAGNYLVVYPTPGCNVPTVACLCRTYGQATCEAQRLNEQQQAREDALQLERRLCGLSCDLEGEH